MGGVAIWVFGVAFGLGLAAHIAWARWPEMLQNVDDLRDRVMRELLRDLDLSQDQAGEIAHILSQHERRFLELRHEQRPKLIREMRSLQESVAGVLEPEQRAEWNRRVDDLFERVFKPLPEPSDDHSRLNALP